MIKKLLATFGVLVLLNQLQAININASSCEGSTKQCNTSNIKTPFMDYCSTGDNNKNICLLYLKRYENKDLQGIEEMFADDIILRDWKIRVAGKEKALHETQINFESVQTIKIEVLSIYENENTVAAELKIIINNKDELYVIDVITINSDNKISSIKAFIGRGD